MIVTSSLARGLVCDAIARQSVRCNQVWARLHQSGVRAPASLRRFREWFEAHERTFQGRAALIMYGRIGRRRGVFTSFMPAFCEDDRGWVLRIDCLRIECEPGRIVDIRRTRLPLTVCGHALERMFQRGETLEWTDVRNALADALVFFSAAHSAYSEGGYLQGPLPVSGGLLVGQFADGVLELKTFLQDGTLRTRHAALLADFRALLADNAEAFHLAAACGDEDATGAVAACLLATRHRWLREPHEPGEDRIGEAWARREKQLHAVR
jgi:hypothetical protein